MGCKAIKYTPMHPEYGPYTPQNAPNTPHGGVLREIGDSMAYIILQAYSEGEEDEALRQAAEDAIRAIEGRE